MFVVSSETRGNAVATDCYVRKVRVEILGTRAQRSRNLHLVNLRDLLQGYVV